MKVIEGSWTNAVGPSTIKPLRWGNVVHLGVTGGCGGVKKVPHPNFENQERASEIIMIHHNQSTYLTRPFYPFYNDASNSNDGD